MSESSYSVIGSWPLVISRAVNAYGIDGRALLQRVGIDPTQTAQPEARCSLTQLNRLWRLALNVTDDPALGLTVASFVRPTSWHALGFAIWASNTVRDGFARLSDNFRMFADYGTLHINTLDDSVEISLHRDPAISVWCASETDAFIGTCVLTARHIYRPDFKPEQVWLSRPQPEDPTPWQRLFKCPVYFNAAYDRILFRREAMHQPLLTASPELAAQNDVLVADYVARMDRADLDAGLDRIWAAMNACIERGVTQGGELPGGLQVKRRAKQIWDGLQKDKQNNFRLEHTVMDWISVYALAVNEENAGGGRVVTAPTNGAAGIIPAVVPDA